LRRRPGRRRWRGGFGQHVPRELRTLRRLDVGVGPVAADFDGPICSGRGSCLMSLSCKVRRSSFWNAPRAANILAVETLPGDPQDISFCPRPMELETEQQRSKAVWCIV